MRHKVAIISTFPPTQCGIGTYAQDLYENVSLLDPNFQIHKIPLLTATTFSPVVGHSINYEESEDYFGACNFLNSEVDVVDIQHEYKIYGKPDGQHIQILLNNIYKPIVTTLHSIFGPSNNIRENILTDIVKRSDFLFVFSTEAKNFIADRYNKRRSKIKAIPHGVPKILFKEPSALWIHKTNNSPLLFASAGHMRNSKGYEIALEALYSIKQLGIKFHYLIIGSNHPENTLSLSYRESLISLTKQLGLNKEVSFIDNYLEKEKLIEYLQAADICLTPYTRREQSSSGILALMIACGRPVVSTPFYFATSYVKDASGIVSESFDACSFGEAIQSVLMKKNLWNDMSMHNHRTGRKWFWGKIAVKYMKVYSILSKSTVFHF